MPAGGAAFPQTSLRGSSSQNTPDPEAGRPGNALHQRLWPHLVAKGQRGRGGKGAFLLSGLQDLCRTTSTLGARKGSLEMYIGATPRLWVTDLKCRAGLTTELALGSSPSYPCSKPTQSRVGRVGLACPRLHGLPTQPSQDSPGLGHRGRFQVDVPTRHTWHALREPRAKAATLE